MKRSKSRFGCERSHHQSVFSRTFSASKICRRDTLLTQIDSNALKFVDRNEATKIHRSSSSIRALASIAKMKQLQPEDEDEEEEEEERGHGNVQEGERQMSHEKIGEMKAEMNAMKLSLELSEREMRMKEDIIESMKIDLQIEKAEFEMILAEKISELNRSKESEARAMNLMSVKEIKAKKLTDELATLKLSEAKTMETFVFQNKLLEQTKKELEDSRFKIASLTEKLETNSPDERFIVNGEANLPNYDDIVSMQQSIENLQVELQRAEDEKMAVFSLRNELKSAIEAEERSNKAMDDLAMALKEVATESNQTKEKLSFTESQLVKVKDEAEQFQELLRNMKREIDFQKNVIGRLRLEAEESHLAWNHKEMVFVDCIKNVEVEKSLLREENCRLAESLKVAETTARILREENHRLRDILKQGLKEANVAKEEVAIAKEESSNLKEFLAEKDESLNIIILENEQLRISIKELKQLHSSATSAAPPKKPPEDKENCKMQIKTGTSEFDEDDFMECDKVFGVPEEEEDPATELNSTVHRRMPSLFMDTVEGDIEQLDSDHDTVTSDGRHSPSMRTALLQKFTDLIRMKSIGSGGGGVNGGSSHSHPHEREVLAE